jgi:hypothetical protein
MPMRFDPFGEMARHSGRWTASPSCSPSWAPGPVSPRENDDGSDDEHGGLLPQPGLAIGDASPGA